MKTAHDFLAPFVGPEPGPYLAYADAVQAVQAVIDHYDPLPGTLALAYRVIDPPNVFPPACPRCTQRPDKCVCPPLFPENPPIRLGQLPAPSQAGSWCWKCRAAPEFCECEQPPF